MNQSNRKETKQERNSQEQVLQNFADTDSQRASALSALHEQLSVAAKGREALEGQVQTAIRDKASLEEALRVTRNEEAEIEFAPPADETGGDLPRREVA